MRKSLLCGIDFVDQERDAVVSVAQVHGNIALDFGRIIFADGP